MSNMQYFPDSRNSGMTPEKSNFAQTCNLLSQYLKENGCLRDLNFGINGKLDAKGGPETSRVTTTTTMNLLSSLENSGKNVESMDLFPQYATNKPSSSTRASMEPKTAQMTIFYAGQVLVFDDFPAEKAREVMFLATQQASSPNTSGFVSSSSLDKIDHGGSMASSSNRLSYSVSSPAQYRLQPHPEAIVFGLPIARRASLQRFFEKRKDRATACAPYQVNNPSTASPKHEEQLELKL